MPDTKELEAGGAVHLVPGWPSVPPLTALRGIYPADLGGLVTYIPLWEYDGVSYVAVPSNGIVAGVVKEAGTPVPYARVAIYYRPTMALIAVANCDSAGQFTFYGLDPTTPATPEQGKYFVVALDPAGGALYNALIYDRIVPQ